MSRTPLGLGPAPHQVHVAAGWYVVSILFALVLLGGLIWAITHRERR